MPEMPLPSDPKLAEIFNRFDVDQTKTIDKVELAQALQELNVQVTEEEITTILSEYDEDGSGELSFDEFRAIFGEAKLRSVFREMDVDNSGNISVDELGGALSALGYKLSQREIRSILRQVDSDASGEVSYSEFYEFFKLVPAASLASIAKHWINQIPIDVGSDLSPPVISPDVPWYYALFGGIGGIISRTFTAPLEKVKLVAQTSSNRISIVSELAKTQRELGWRGLFAGNAANCFRVFPYAGIVTICYLRGLKMTPADDEFDTWEPFYRGGVAATAGIIGQLCTYPLDVIRARLTVNPQAHRGLIDCGRSIFKESGTRGLYKGLSPTLFAVAPFLACQMSTADAMKSKAAENDIEVTPVKMACIGSIAGATAQTVVYPLDVLRRRMQTQSIAGSNNVLSDSTWLAMRQVVQREGFRSLFSGITVTYIKVMPACAVGMTVTRELIQLSQKWDDK